MTEIAFHFNAPAKTEYACRLLRKALGRGAKLVVTGPREMLARLDVELWTFGALEFLPHCTESADAATRERSPVYLCGDLQSAPHHDVLVHLGDSVPHGFERFARVIEVVTGDEADRLSARARWKHYADRGYAIVRHDLAAKAATDA